MYEKLEGLEEKYKITEFPLNIGIEITNYCNLNCIMCNNDKLTRPKGYMSMALYKKIIDEIAKENPATRIWLDFYGEALLAGWKLYYMIDYAKKKGCTNICINTNGTLMKPEYADMLLDAGTDYISIDCDGFSKDVYEAIRRGSDRDTFYANVEYLLKENARRGSKTMIDVKIMEMEENKEEIDTVLDYWQKRGAWTAVRRCSTWVDSDTVANNKLGDGDSRIACGHALGTCVITWDGDVAGCAFDADCHIKFGNICEQTIKSIWERRNQEFVAVHMEHRWEDLDDMCKGCMNWKNIGEMRYDENGNNIDRNYDLKDDIFKK